MCNRVHLDTLVLSGNTALIGSLAPALFPPAHAFKSVRFCLGGSDSLFGVVMTKKFAGLLLSLLFLFSAVLCFARSASARGVKGTPFVVRETRHDISPPARQLALVVPRAARMQALREEREEKEEVFESRNAPSIRPDTVVQTSVAATLIASVVLNFDGLASNGYRAPDGNGAVGATQFVETTNGQYAVYDKTTGTLLLGPVVLSTLWAGFGDLCETGIQFDPIVLYDKAAGRWFISQFVEDSTLTSFMQCLAVSTTSDATGSYARYEFSSGTTQNDYPKFGVWADAYYGSSNQYANAVTFIGSQVCAYDRSAMLAGQSAQAICFLKSGTKYLLPSDLDGSTPPPAGSPNYFVKLGSPLPSTSLKLYRFHADFTNPPNSTFKGPVSIPINPWVRLCPTTTACIPEPSPGEKVNPMANRLMYRLAYRNFGDHESLVANHTVDAGGGIAGVRWYEIRSPRSLPFVYQQGTYSIPATYLLTGTIAMDGAGDIALGMNASSTTQKPSVLITGQVPTDPPGTLEDAQTVLVGTGVQTKNTHHWGDYASIAVDPVDDCTFWYTSEYYKTTGIGTWNTRIVAFKFPNCI